MSDVTLRARRTVASGPPPEGLDFGVLAFADEEEALYVGRANPALPPTRFTPATATEGPPGPSAYQVAIANGFVGTEAQWLASLEGAPGSPGSSAYQVAIANGFVGTEAQWLASLEGAPGAPGSPGSPGPSAYQVAIANGFVGTEAQWLASLEGAPGADGQDGQTFIWDFETTIAAGGWTNGTLISVPHGLAAAPALFRVDLICVTAEGQFNPGDTIPFLDNDFYINQVRLNATHVSVWIEQVPYRLNFNTANSRQVLSPSRWAVRVQASSLIPPIQGQPPQSGGAWTLLANNLTIPNTATTSIPHALGASIQDVRWMAECVTADRGYTPGQILPLNDVFPQSEATPFWDATNVYLRMGDVGLRAVEAASPSYQTLTQSRWRIYVEVQ